METKTPGFYVASFGIDGVMEGRGYWEFAKLSPRWLEVCAQQMVNRSGSFRVNWEGELSHLAAKITIAQGIALLTFEVDGLSASSLLFLNGAARPAEEAMLKMFVESLKKVEAVREAIGDLPPFLEMFSLKERPLAVVIPWPNDEISESDHALVQELAIHTAGAFFRKESQQMVEPGE